MCGFEARMDWIKLIETVGGGSWKREMLGTVVSAVFEEDLRVGLSVVVRLTNPQELLKLQVMNASIQSLKRRCSGVKTE